MKPIAVNHVSNEPDRSRFKARRGRLPHVSKRKSVAETAEIASPSPQQRRAEDRVPIMPDSDRLAMLGSPNHAVHFYETDANLLRTITEFLSSGMRVGAPAVAIVGREHKSYLSEVFASEVTSGLCKLMDARDTLASFMTDGMPDGDKFRQFISNVLAGLPPAPARANARLFGEMVDLLWREGKQDAAIALESLWDETSHEQTFELLCGYFMGNFGQNSHAERFARVCQCHGGIQPDYLTTSDGSQAQARELRRLQQRAKSLGSELEQRKQLELSLREALKQRAIVERELRASLEREQEARAKSEASDAFKETFLGMIGHDLLNPLHTILTTSRLMKMRQELPEESRKRLERIIASGIRMQRMIEQIHDLTRSRLSSGLVISRNAEHDLVSMVTRIIDQLRTANPAQRFELRAEASCNALVDENRIEQVICNLIGNAIAHGDPDQPVRVAIWSTETAAHLTVHNFGLPIDPEFLPRLFEPFKTGRKPQGQSAGLGLGLYISERIIAAHGGTLEVDSSLDSGTCFRITLPLHCGDR